MTYSILIVDSQREHTRALQEALENLPKTVITTGVLSGEEALLEARLNPVDVLVTDTRLPGMPGAELVRAVRLVRPGVKTIFLSRTPRSDSHAEAFAAGVDANFLKPVPLQEFLAVVAELLEIEPPSLDRKQAVEPVSETENAVPEMNVSDRMVDLRQEIKAECVSLVNESGEVIIRAGSLQDPEFEASILPSLMSAYSQGLKVSHILGQTNQRNIHFYYGETYDLVMSSISSSHALVVATRHLISGADTSTLHEKIHRAHTDIALILEKIGVPMQIDEPKTAPPFASEPIDVAIDDEEGHDQELESLLIEPAQTSLKNADAFWETGEEAVGTGPLTPDSLSYDQALRLGLIPEDNN